MIEFEHTEVFGFAHAIRGMRNPLNSWNKSDSIFPYVCDYLYEDCDKGCPLYIDNGGIDNKCDLMGMNKAFVGPNDYDLMTRLRNAGTDHRKFMRMIVVYVDITAPLYWWKEFDTYKVGTVANSCSTMHKIGEKEFTMEDFSCEHLAIRSLKRLHEDILELNFWRNAYNCKDDCDRSQYFANNEWWETYIPAKKECWWQMIQLLPTSYNQKRTVMLNYEVLANIYKSRKNHKLDEWSIGFMNWIESSLPYSELITGKEK